MTDDPQLGILKNSILAIGEDTKLIRLATLTTFIHSLLFIIYLAYIVITLEKSIWNGVISDLLWEYIDIVIPGSERRVVLILIGIFLVIGYAILPPIWEAAMIYYVDSDHKSGSLSLGQGTGRFFPMFEFNATLTFLSLSTLIIASSRLLAMNSINGITLTLLSLWLFISVIAMILLPYTKFVITLEGESYFDAMRASMGLAIRHLGTTLWYVLINFFLYIRYILNIIIVVGIPLGMLRWASSMDIADTSIFQILVISVIIWLVALTAYINGIIEAFFISYRWRVYKKIN